MEAKRNFSLIYFQAKPFFFAASAISKHMMYEIKTTGLYSTCSWYFLNTNFRSCSSLLCPFWQATQHGQLLFVQLLCATIVSHWGSNHRAAEASRLAVFTGERPGHWVSHSRFLRAVSSQFWVFSGMETSQLLWAICFSVQPLSEWNKFPLMFKWNFV